MTNEVNFLGPINQLGYGVAASNIAIELAKLIRVNLFPIGHQTSNVSPKNEKLFQNLLQNSRTGQKNVPCVKIWHQHQLYEHISRKYYGWPIFELDTFTEHEIANLKWPDELIVCSQWAKSIVEKYIDSPVHVIPLGVDTSIFYPKEKHAGPYRFFNIGKTEIRKGHDILCECFNRAFDINDDVELHIAWDNPFLNPVDKQRWYESYKMSRLGDKIFFHGRKNSHSEIADLINFCDCAIMPSRAEGWNLEALESMACEKPVIITNYSAHTEFCNKDNSYLVDIGNTEPAYDGIWFHGQGNWAHIGEIQKEQMVAHMRECYKNQPKNRSGLETASHFTWKHSAEKLYGILNN